MASQPLLISKLKAFAIHMAISLAIFAALLYLIVMHWYPGVLFSLDGGWQGVRIMLFVDIVAGPLLTLLIYNPAKPRRERQTEFAVIGLIQALALGWGIHAVHSQRPLALVFFDRAFYTLQPVALTKQGKTSADLDAFGRTPLAEIYAAPEGPEQAIAMTVRAIMEGVPEYEQFDLYRPLAPNLAKVFARQIDLDALLKAQPDAGRQLDALLQSAGGGPGDYHYVRIDGRFNQATLVLTPAGKIIGALPPP